MALSPAAKVGAATLASLVAIGAGLSWLTSFSFRPEGYDFEVAFADVAGLLKGANVYYMGVKVGRVTQLEPHEHMVDVKVHVADSDTKLPANGRYKIMSMGIIGEKALEIFPPKHVHVPPGQPQPTPVPLVWLATDGDAKVRGDDPARMELVMDELTDTFEDFRKTTDPKKFQELFTKTADNLYETTETVKRLGKQAEGIMSGFASTPRGVNQFIGGINRLANNADRLLTAANPREVQLIVRDMRSLSGGLLKTYEGFFGESQAAVNQKSAGDLRNMIGQLDQLARTLNQTAGDPEIQRDLKDTMKNIRELSARVGGIASVTEPKNFQGFSISPTVQGIAANTPTGTGLAANLGVKVNLANNHVLAGIEQVGEGNYFNLALGDSRVWGPTGYHFGLIRSKIGVGIDYGLTDQISLLGQLYDPFRPTFRLGASYFPLAGSQYGLLAQWARTVQTNENYIWLGVEWRPVD
jgi:ABC-type transporter Mla subunit MlaD